MKLPRHTTFVANLAQLVLQLGENARDVIEALKERPVRRRIVVEEYSAAGSTSARIRIGAGGRPWAVVLVHVSPAYAQDTPVTCRPTLSFVWDATTKAIDVFEPEGLTADTVYRMQFSVEEE